MVDTEFTGTSRAARVVVLIEQGCCLGWCVPEWRVEDSSCAAAAFCRAPLRVFETLEQGFARFPVWSYVAAEHDGSGHDSPSAGEGLMGIEDGLPGGEGVVYE